MTEQRGEILGWTRLQSEGILGLWHLERALSERGLVTMACGRTWDASAPFDATFEPPPASERCPACQGAYASFDQQPIGRAP